MSLPANSHLAPQAASLQGFFDLVARSPARRIAIVGLAKNAGKTTAANAIMAHVPQRFGLTSLGLDGERRDHLTGLAKPRVVPPAGTLVATTTGSLERSHYPLRLIDKLPFTTALGQVVIGCVNEGGQAIEISGPTALTEVRRTADRLLELGAQRVLVDGAINRLGSASPRVTDALIMATGAMIADSLAEVVDTTRATLDVLTLPRTGETVQRLLHGYHLDRARLLCIDSHGSAQALPLSTLIGQGAAVAREVQRLGAQTVVAGGALTEDFLTDLLRLLPPRRRLRLVVRDPTVLMIPAVSVTRLRRRLTLEVLHPLNVLAVTANPFHLPCPLKPTQFFSAVADTIGDRVPVFDVINGLARYPSDEPRATSGTHRAHRPQQGR